MQQANMDSIFDEESAHAGFLTINRHRRSKILTVMSTAGPVPATNIEKLNLKGKWRARETHINKNITE